MSPGTRISGRSSECDRRARAAADESHHDILGVEDPDDVFRDASKTGSRLKGLAATILQHIVRTTSQHRRSQDARAAPSAGAAVRSRAAARDAAEPAPPARAARRRDSRRSAARSPPGECTCRWPVAGTPIRRISSMPLPLRKGNRPVEEPQRPLHRKHGASATRVGFWSASDFGTSSPMITASGGQEEQDGNSGGGLGGVGVHAGEARRAAARPAARWWPVHRRRGSGSRA